MKWILEFIFGPAVPENINYEVIQDITSLIPWWYPHFVAGCMALFLVLLWAGYHKKSARIVPAPATLAPSRDRFPHDH